MYEKCILPINTYYDLGGCSVIKNKRDLKEYLVCDKNALGYSMKRRPRIGRDEIWRFEILLRKYEYFSNLEKKNILQKVKYLFYKVRFHRLSVRLGFSIPINVFGKGLSIAHYGSIVVNGNAKIGKNCRIQENTTIGSTGGSAKAPWSGDNVFIASGARIIGDIYIGDNVAVGANAVVVKSCEKNGVTLAGIPAKIISNHDSSRFIKATAIKENIIR